MAEAETPGWLSLGDGEEILWQDRPHPIEMGPRVPVGIAIALVGLLMLGWFGTGSAVFVAIGTLVAVIGLALALQRYLVWWNTRYVITSGGLFHKTGVVTRNVAQLRLERVQNTRLEQSVFGRALGYGELSVYTAGSGEPEVTFDRVPRPNRVADVLSRRLDTVTLDRA